jgi:hypothetical protein
MHGSHAVKALALLGAVVGATGYALAQEAPGVGVVTTLVGEATVTRATRAQPLALRTHDDVFRQDRISTKERSLVHVLMGGKALLSVRELSVLTVTDEAGRATVNLQSGKIGLAVLRQRMKPGEVIEIHTPNAVAAVRGTVVVVEVSPGSASEDHPTGGSTTRVHLLHGKLDVSLRSDPAAAPVQLESLQTVTVSGHTLGTVRPLSLEAAAAITADLKANPSSRPALPAEFQAAVGARQRDLAIERAAALVGGGPGRGTGGVDGILPAAAKSQKSNEAGSSSDDFRLVSDPGDRGLALGVGGVNAGGNGGGTGPGLALGLGNGNGVALGVVGVNAGGNGGGTGPGLALGVGSGLRSGIGAGLTGGGAVGSGTGGAGSGLTSIVPPGLMKKIK